MRQMMRIAYNGIMRPYFIMMTLSAITMLPSLVFAAPQTYGDLINILLGLINSAIGVLIAMAIVIYFWGAVSQMWESQEGKVHGPKSNFMVWGLVAIFVMVSIWGIINLLINTFFSGGTGSSS